MSKKSDFDERAVRDLAYRLWEQRGKPIGRAEEDWHEAERRLRAEQRGEPGLVDEALKETFPASDPPTMGVPDEPPANAEEKWRAAEQAQATKGEQPRRRARSAEAQNGGSKRPPRTGRKVGPHDTPGG